MRVFSPCKDCTRRKVGCQGKCKDYEKYLEEYHAIKKYISPNEADMYIAEQKRKKKKK